ncbi:MAG: PleD family two-component system response regulator [Elusimicrobiota bacterium]
MMKYKILIIEDDEDTATIQSLSLAPLGFDVEIINHGNKALLFIKQWQPDILILDLELPGKSGVEILQELSKETEFNQMIIIANTIHMDIKDDLGFSYYTHFLKWKNKEPTMINKLSRDESKRADIRHVIATMLMEKFGVLPPAFSQWLKLNPA